MKIKELHKDIERYLLHGCYCPHEIYSFDGFGYQLFNENDECEFLGKSKEPSKYGSYFIGCVAYPSGDRKRKPQVLMFTITKNDKCLDAIRFDATENNLKIVKDVLENGVNDRKFKFDEYTPGSTTKSLKEILSIADAVMID